MMNRMVAYLSAGCRNRDRSLQMLIAFFMLLALSNCASDTAYVKQESTKKINLSGIHTIAVLPVYSSFDLPKNILYTEIEKAILRKGSFSVLSSEAVKKAVVDLKIADDKPFDAQTLMEIGRGLKVDAVFFSEVVEYRCKDLEKARQDSPSSNVTIGPGGTSAVGGSFVNSPRPAREVNLVVKLTASNIASNSEIYTGTFKSDLDDENSDINILKSCQDLTTECAREIAFRIEEKIFQ